MWTEFNALIQMGQIISIKNCLQYLASGLGPVIWSITGNNSRSTWFYGPPSRHATGTVEASAGCQVCNHDTRLLQFFFSFSKAWSLEVALNIFFYLVVLRMLQIWSASTFEVCRDAWWSYLARDSQKLQAFVVLMNNRKKS